jgi:hypothetical protein
MTNSALVYEPNANDGMAMSSAVPMKPPVSTTIVKLVAKFAAGVVYTGGKFATGVVDTGGQP